MSHSMFLALPLRLRSIELPGPRELFSVRLNLLATKQNLDVPLYLYPGLNVGEKRSAKQSCKDDLA